MPDVVEGVYLSGWEYNRLLQSEPLVPRVSALPAEILWNGAAHLWMFKEVWCTKESLAAEVAAADVMGWKTGQIFTELANMGIIRTLDWENDLSSITKTSLGVVHKALRKKTSDGASIREAIESRDVRTLERIKFEYLSPIAENLGLVLGTTPNSLQLSTWKRSADPSIAAQIEVRKFLSRLSEPILKPGSGDFSPSGLRLCDRPGTGVDPNEVKRQQIVQEKHEAPMISELLAGEGPYTGPEGFVPYFEALAPHRKAYDEINNQLYANWTSNRKHLLELRRKAEKGLWPQLHREWLPQILADPKSAEGLATHIDAATRRLGYLDMPTAMAFLSVPFGSVAISRVLGELADLTAGDVATIATITGGTTMAALTLRKDFREAVVDIANRRNISVFYQKAAAIKRKTT
ncbi:hypothetical protein [Nocardia gipuzkoensis]|uniref:hypothetical protein n=1 Tax=Nocardia gipuzkoensis TaxID=2749991 RepID=UPI00237EB032|nr:hypothetical protein [Nocardia gipuzkoensis]MDE1672676.1 hypothetical protein [Nocardia gipuzkoensis]